MNGNGKFTDFSCFKGIHKGEDTFSVDAGGGILEQILTLFVVYVASRGGPTG